MTDQKLKTLATQVKDVQAVVYREPSARARNATGDHADAVPLFPLAVDARWYGIYWYSPRPAPRPSLLGNGARWLWSVLNAMRPHVVAWYDRQAERRRRLTRVST